MVSFSDNTTAVFALSSLPNVNMTSSSLSITTSQTEATYPMSSVANFSFAVDAGLADILAEGSYYEGDELIVPDGAALVYVFSGSGVLISVPVRRTDNSVRINLGSLPAGVYVINVNGKSVKIVRR